MTTTHTYRGIVWTDFQSPDDAEIATVVKRYSLHPLVGEDLKSSVSASKVSVYKDYIMIVMTLPIRIKKEDGYVVDNREIDFVIGKNFLITSHLDSIEQLEYFAKVFEANAILDKDEKIERASRLFYYMVKRIYAGMHEDLENIKDTLINAEERIFLGEERKMVEVLSNISRELIDFKQTTRIHHTIWTELSQCDSNEVCGGNFSEYIKDMRDQFTSINERIINTRELLTDLRETNDSLLDTKQTETIKVLTLGAFIFCPLTFLAALLTIPLKGVPLEDDPHGWNIIAGVMVVAAVAIYTGFKKKKWL